MLRAIGIVTIVGCVAACIAYAPVAGAKVRLRLARRRVRKEEKRAAVLARLYRDANPALKALLEEDAAGVPFLSASTREAVERIVSDERKQTE